MKGLSAVCITLFMLRKHYRANMFNSSSADSTAIIFHSFEPGITNIISGLKRRKMYFIIHEHYHKLNYSEHPPQTIISTSVALGVTGLKLG